MRPRWRNGPSWAHCPWVWGLNLLALLIGIVASCTLPHKGEPPNREPTSEDPAVRKAEPAADREPDSEGVASAVIQESREGDLLRYIIGRLDRFEPDTRALEYLKEHAGARSVAFDAEKKRIVILNESPIPDLPTAWDETAFGGALPFLDELEARSRYDTPAATLKVAFTKRLDPFDPWEPVFERVDPDRLRITCKTPIWSDGGGGIRTGTGWKHHQWLLHHEENGYTLSEVDPIVDLRPANQLEAISCSRLSPSGSIPVSISATVTGTLHTNRLTAHCMAHYRFAIRVVDPSGKLLAIEEEELRASTAVTAFDLSGDGRDELVIFREDHGDTDIVVLTLTHP